MERATAETLAQAVAGLREEHEQERARLREEHGRMHALQAQLLADGAHAREATRVEREALSRDRQHLAAQQLQWEAQATRESKELEGRAELLERKRCVPVSAATHARDRRR